ncbi:hypothetical protein G4V62_07605 [Bacillaceae bacterium SIJ1]|uniref:YusW family protein n=1 Tax=Litoribacterium kuwaitense TaxID=1398745 RepID=UPI0013EAD1B7|nr:YusW family protein [Litoribacterium kuwaitense]NGP44830.1 hypothetical protein [Litoribacterium kuwaitense]
MDYFKRLLLIFVACLSLTSCGVQPEDIDAPPPNEMDDQSKDQMTSLPFQSFSFNATLPEDHEFALFVGTNDDTIDMIELRDDRSSEVLHGEAAIERLSPLHETLSSVENRKAKEILYETLQTFALQNDFKQAHIKVTLSSGEVKTYEANPFDREELAEENETESPYFSAFYLTATFPEKSTYSIMYDHKNLGESFIHDERNDIRLVGSSAVVQLDPLFRATNIQKQTSEADALRQVMNLFLLRNAENIALDIYFTDETQRSYLYEKEDKNT